MCVCSGGLKVDKFPCGLIEVVTFVQYEPSVLASCSDLVRVLIRFHLLLRCARGGKDSEST